MKTTTNPFLIYRDLEAKVLIPACVMSIALSLAPFLVCWAFTFDSVSTLLFVELARLSSASIRLVVCGVAATVSSGVVELRGVVEMSLLLSTIIPPWEIEICHGGSAR